MNREQILDAIRELSFSQGFYGRLLRDIMESPKRDEILDELEAQNFGDVLDMVLYFES